MLQAAKNVSQNTIIKKILRSRGGVELKNEQFTWKANKNLVTQANKLNVNVVKVL